VLKTNPNEGFTACPREASLSPNLSRWCSLYTRIAAEVNSCAHWC
jgi:hypothetical protein